VDAVLISRQHGGGISSIGDEHRTSREQMDVAKGLEVEQHGKSLSAGFSPVIPFSICTEGWMLSASTSLEFGMLFPSKGEERRLLDGPIEISKHK